MTVRSPRTRTESAPPRPEGGRDGRPAEGCGSGGTPPTAPAARIEAVDDGADGQRLDNFLARLCKGVPKSHLYRLIRSGQVRVNGARADADRRLALGDRVRVPPVRMSAQVTAAERAAPPQWRRRGEALPIVHEDDALLVLDKPAGTAVHGGSGVSAGAIELVRAARPAQRFLELVHRLDRDTSGLLVIAKTRVALVALHAQWRARLPSKHYLAVVFGRVGSRERLLDAPLRRFVSASGERRVTVDEAEGREASTRLRGLAHGEVAGVGTVSLVSVEILTGRTHQIRVHLAQAGYPIVGDVKYGDYARNRELGPGPARRLFLHAHRLRFRHPVSGTMLEFESIVPAAFAALVPAAATLAQDPPPGAAGRRPPAAGRRSTPVPCAPVSDPEAAG